MTLIGAPNGSGKSTWCAFLRTMLYGLDTRQPCTKAESLEPGKPRRSQSQHPAAHRQSTPSRGQQEPGESQHQRTQGKASTQQRRRGCKASRKRQPYPAQGTGNACAHAEPAPNQTPEPAPPPAPREPTIWRGREGGEGRRERGSAQKITALQRRPAPAPDEATA